MILKHKITISANVVLFKYVVPNENGMSGSYRFIYSQFPPCSEKAVQTFSLFGGCEEEERMSNHVSHKEKESLNIIFVKNPRKGNPLPSAKFDQGLSAFCMCVGGVGGKITHSAVIIGGLLFVLLKVLLHLRLARGSSRSKRQLSHGLSFGWQTPVSAVRWKE